MYMILSGTGFCVVSEVFKVRVFKVLFQVLLFKVLFLLYGAILFVYYTFLIHEKGIFFLFLDMADRRLFKNNSSQRCYQSFVSRSQLV